MLIFFFWQENGQISESHGQVFAWGASDLTLLQLLTKNICNGIQKTQPCQTLHLSWHPLVHISPPLGYHHLRLLGLHLHSTKRHIAVSIPSPSRVTWSSDTLIAQDPAVNTPSDHVELPNMDSAASEMASPSVITPSPFSCQKATQFITHPHAQALRTLAPSPPSAADLLQLSISQLCRVKLSHLILNTIIYKRQSKRTET